MYKKSFILHIDSLCVLDELTDEQAGQLFKAIKLYHEGKEFPLDDIIKIAFLPLQKQFERDIEKYNSMCKRNKINGLNGGRPKTQKTQMVSKKPKKPDNDNDNVNDKEKENIKRKSFKQPALEEVIEYCKERNNSVDAQQFIDHYTSNGWMVGRNSMKDWRAAIRSQWEKQKDWQKSDDKKDYTEENIAKINSITNSVLKYKDCWSALNKLKNDVFLSAEKRNKAEGIVGSLKNKPLSEAYLKLIEGILTDYCK